MSAFSTKVENADMTKNFLFYRFLRVFRVFSNVSAFSTKVENADKTENFLFVSAVRSLLSVCPRFPPNLEISSNAIKRLSL